MLDSVVVDAGPSRLTRALGVLVVAALAIAPAALLPEPPPSVTKSAACAIHHERVRAQAAIETRAPGLNPRFLQRELGHRAAPAR